MTLYKASFHIPARTGLSRDDTVNSFYFKTPTPRSLAQLTAMAAVLEAFYNTNPSGHGTHVASYFSRDRDDTTGRCRVDWYAIPNARTVGPKGYPAYGPPISSDTASIVLYAGTSAPLPDQVAMCLSYRGDTAGTPNPRRRRGRIFLGPLNQLTLTETGAETNAQTISSTARQVVLGAATEQLKTAMEALPDAPRWQVWSPADWESHDVIEASMDDRYDTQRRRLQKPTVRQREVIT